MMNRAERRVSSKGRRVAAGAAIAAASLMSTYLAGLRPATGYASAAGGAQTRSAPMIPTCADADVTVTTAAQLRSAVAASHDDSVICVDGTINLTGTGGAIGIPETSTVTIVGAGSGATINAPTDDSGIFRASQISSNPDDTLTFSNLTLQGGLADRGGAIIVQTLSPYAISDSLVIDDVTFINNEARGGYSARGGAVYADRLRSVSISNSTFTGNVSVGYGGAMYVNRSADLTITDSTFSGNSVSGMTGGGALSTVTTGTASIESSLFDANSSDASAGGAALMWGNAIEISGSTFTGNSAVAGGALTFSNFGNDPDVTLANSTFVDNTATDDVTVSGSGYDGGGAILALGARLTLDFVTMTGNTADDSAGAGSGVGGSVHVSFGAADDTLTITNSIVAGNTAVGSGRDIAVSDSRVSTVIDYTALTDPSSVVTAGPRSILNALYGSLASLLLGPLQDNGGATPTRLPAATSPVIDAGNPAWAPPPQFDQRGTGFPRKLGDIVDLGAVEAGAAPGPGPDPDPTPTPVYPPSPPLNPEAAAGDASAEVTWRASATSGSFPVSTYQVTASPGGQGCLTSTLTCTVSNLVNGTAYTFTVKALNGAGWSAASAPSDPVTPRATPQPTATIMITGTRSARTIEITGSTRAIEPGSQVTPWIRKHGAAQAQAGRPQAIDHQGEFTWSRRVRSDGTLRAYVTWGDVRSNVVRLPAGRTR
jgi:predicted outer membrane repeat protein